MLTALMVFVMVAAVGCVFVGLGVAIVGGFRR